MISMENIKTSLSLRNMKITSKLTVLVCVTLAGFIGFAAVAYTTLNAVKVNGALYDEISQGQNMIADTAPPTLNVMTIRLIVARMGDDAGNKEAVQADVESLRAAEKKVPGKL